MFEFLKKDEIEVINVNDLDNLIGKIKLIDIREPYEYASGTIKSAKNIPMGDLLSETDKYLDKQSTSFSAFLSGAYYCLNMGMIATSTFLCTIVVHIYFRGSGPIPTILRKVRSSTCFFFRLVLSFRFFSNG